MAVADIRRVFAYGSLLSEPSLLRTLPHRTAAPRSTPFVLADVERAWNVVSVRTFAVPGDPTGALHRRLVLGLADAPGARCEGIVLDLTAEDLVALDAREAAYALTSVATAEDGTTVWTYLPRPERIVGRHAVAEPLVIERSYLAGCRDGAIARHLHDALAEIDRSVIGLPLVESA